MQEPKKWSFVVIGDPQFSSKYGPIMLVFPADILHKVVGTKLFKYQQNLGTVIYEKIDCNNHCWTNEEFTVLNSRRVFHDLLPKANVCNSHDDQFMLLLIDYLQISLECVHKLTIGKSKHLMLKALADTMGGYLQVYILPAARQAYYAGTMKYQNVKRLVEIFEQLKEFLRTNGSGWRKHLSMINHINATSITIEPPKSSLACSGFIIYEGVPGIKRDLAPVTIPLPYLDNEIHPNSIALPFRTENLQSLYDERSAFVLVKYYIASTKCVTSKSKTNEEIMNFHANFYDWLQQYVYPHLNDEKWYPAFGGVLRILRSLKEAGVEPCKENSSSEDKMMSSAITETKTNKKTKKPELTSLFAENEVYSSTSFGINQLIAIGVASAVLVWILLGMTLLCYRCLKRNSDQCSPRSSHNSTPVAVLFKSQHCKPDTCISRLSVKSIGEKHKSWWKKKFNRKCFEGDSQCDDEERCLGEINYSSMDTIDDSNSKLF